VCNITIGCCDSVSLVLTGVTDPIFASLFYLFMNSNVCLTIADVHIIMIPYTYCVQK